jgi:hypothetical protein
MAIKLHLEANEPTPATNKIFLNDHAAGTTDVGHNHFSWLAGRISAKRNRPPLLSGNGGLLLPPSLFVLRRTGRPTRPARFARIDWR